jgi:RNA polymerase sigma factor (sigma-70 family)
MAATESSTRAMAALDDLYRRHVGDVYRYTYAVLGNHADAEDVTQTTFVNALRALERGEVPREPSHWLLAIAHNLVRQRWRQAAARPTMVELVHDVPDEPGEDDIQLDELVKALQRIPPSQREALVMRELEGRSYKEIAELLGLTTSALETLLFRARRSLAEELENLVTCQTAELALSRDSDGRLSRKERKRLDEHIAECPSCARFSRTTAQQRKAFKGLAMLPLPVGLALFKETSAAAAATVATIGEGGATTGAGIGTGGAATGGTAAGGSITVGGTVAGGSLLGGAAVKFAAIVAAASVAVGVGYQGVKTLGADAPESTTAAGAPLAKAGASAMATAAPGTAGSAAASDSSVSTLPTVPVSGGTTAGAKVILPADPHADAPTAASPASDAPTSGGTSSPDAGAAPAPGGSPGSSPGGGAGGAAPGAPPPGGDPGGTPPSGGGDGPTGGQPPGTAPSPPPTTAPSPATTTTGPNGEAKAKGKPKKPPKAKTPPKGKPTTTPPRGKPTTTPPTATPTTKPPKAKNPKTSPTAGTTPGGGSSPTTGPKEPKAHKEPKNDPTGSATVAPPATQPTAPPASAPPTETAPTPTGDGGSSAPDNGNGNGGDNGNRGKGA